MAETIEKPVMRREFSCFFILDAEEKIDISHALIDFGLVHGFILVLGFFFVVEHAFSVHVACDQRTALNCQGVFFVTAGLG